MVVACRQAACGRGWGHLALFGSQLTFSKNFSLHARRFQVTLKREERTDGVVCAVFTDHLQASLGDLLGPVTVDSLTARLILAEFLDCE